MTNALFESITWDDRGLLVAIAQEASTGRVLMQAWMNRDALRETMDSGYATYWSRSRQSLWRKGEQSGNRQKILSMELDCDGDSLLMLIEQEGGIACHTGRHSCYYRYRDGSDWKVGESVIKDPEAIYGRD